MIKENESQSLDRLAIALIHFYDKARFLAKLAQLDRVCEGLPVTFYVYNAPHAVSQQLLPSDTQQWHTPIRLITGDSTSRAAAYNALFRSISNNHVLTLIIERSMLRSDWWDVVGPLLHVRKVGVWGGRVGLGDTSLSAHDSFWHGYNRRQQLIETGSKAISWIDLRFFLVRTKLAIILDGFEEQYFMGNMYVRDFCWRVIRSGSLLSIISKSVVRPWNDGIYPSSRSLMIYYAVRNQWMFARLRLGWIRGLIVMIVRLLVDGVWGKQLHTTEYINGLRDGLSLFLKRAKFPTNTS